MARWRVRDADPHDAHRIAEIHVRTWQCAYRGLFPDELLDALSVPERTEFWIDRLRRGETTVLVAARGGVVAGWLAYGDGRDDDAVPGSVEVYGLYVAPEAWRSGAGRALWEAAAARIDDDRGPSVTLWVLADNERGRRFYESVGFRLEEGPCKEFRKGEVVRDEVRYRWWPSGAG